MIVQLTHEAQTKALLKRKVECYRRMETEEHSIAGEYVTLLFVGEKIQRQDE